MVSDGILPHAGLAANLGAALRTGLNTGILLSDSGFVEADFADSRVARRCAPPSC